MKSFFANLFGAKTRLSELEKLILSSVSAQLGSDLRTLLDKQLAAVNKIQRLPEGVEVNFYQMQHGRPNFDAALAFPNKTEGLRVAKVKIGLPHVHERLTASVWCVNGFLFSITYSGRTNYFEEAAGGDPQPEFELSCRLLADLSQIAS